MRARQRLERVAGRRSGHCGTPAPQRVPSPGGARARGFGVGRSPRGRGFPRGRVRRIVRRSQREEAERARRRDRAERRCRRAGRPMGPSSAGARPAASSTSAAVPPGLGIHRREGRAARAGSASREIRGTLDAPPGGRGASPGRRGTSPAAGTNAGFGSLVPSGGEHSRGPFRNGGGHLPLPSDEGAGRTAAPNGVAPPRPQGVEARRGPASGSNGCTRRQSRAAACDATRARWSQSPCRDGPWSKAACRSSPATFGPWRARPWPPRSGREGRVRPGALDRARSAG